MSELICQTTGRRKASVARVCLYEGDGQITVNGRTLQEHFPSETQRMLVTEPLRAVEQSDKFNIDATITGGGVSGQAGALLLGIARGLVEADPETRGTLKRHGFLTRDPRVKERKKYGLKKARKAPQFSKR